ncbi:MAG: hypothetical protein ACLR3O_02820 [Streptococcus sp.]
MGNEEGLGIDMAGLSQPTPFQLTVLLNGQKYLDKKDHQNFIMALLSLLWKNMPILRIILCY